MVRKMNIIKELVLREFDDSGADAIENYWAQIEYTAYWCINMILPQSGIIGVIPEGIEDVTIVRDQVYELHQVKCRDESQSPWATAEVLPIICKQYNRRRAFTKPCHFHFVSDHVADNKTQFKPGVSYGPLYRLKSFLETQHQGQNLTPDESCELAELEKELLRRIKEIMSDEHGEQIDDVLARELLHSTWIETKSPYVRNRPFYEELSSALQSAYPGQPLFTLPQIQDLYKRILILVVEKIIKGNTLINRTIKRDDIVNCRTASVTPESGLPDLDKLPGNSRADKKAIYAGFDASEMPVFALQRMKADEKRRQFEILGLGEKLDDLTLALMTRQLICRRAQSKLNNYLTIGPDILEMLQSQICLDISKYCPNNNDIDEVICQGLIWNATNECHLWWHRLDSSGYQS
jgi:hypothetical protein